MTMIFETKHMPPMICGHPDLIPGWITPDGGGRPEPEETLLYIPEKMEFAEPEGYDEFTADLMYAFRRPVSLPWRGERDLSIGSRAVVDDWIMENEPEWSANDRPVFVRHEIRESFQEES